MAWVERFTCDICGKLMGDAESWWVAMSECAATNNGNARQPMLKLTQWDNLLGHQAGSKHLCGAGCTHTFLDRWMAGLNAGTDICAD